MALRGFDAYEVSLGDEMRGERASMGKSLLDAERDMRIKADIIEAIEDSDVSGFPNQSVIAGYVRSYARYLGMDQDRCFERFCAESGYVSPAALRQSTQRVGDRRMSGAMAPLSGSGGLASPFGTTSTTSISLPRVSFGAIMSSFALVGLISGLAYGGYELLKEIQRVGFAPLPEAPSVVADAPVISPPSLEADALARPTPEDFENGGAFAAVVMPSEVPGLGHAHRDGPISAIDPSASGIFAELAKSPSRPNGDVFAAGNDAQRIQSTKFAGRFAAGRSAQPEDGVVLVAAEDAWVRIRGDGGAVLYEGILGAGERFDLPNRLSEPVLRAGNAGGIFIFVDGVAYGPVGERGRVVSGVSLLAKDVRTSVPEAIGALPQPVFAPATEQRADASLLPANR